MRTDMKRKTSPGAKGWQHDLRLYAYIGSVNVQRVTKDLRFSRTTSTRLIPLEKVLHGLHTEESLVGNDLYFGKRTKDNLVSLLWKL